MGKIEASMVTWRSAMRRGGPSPSQAIPVVACILVAMLGVQAVGEVDVEEQATGLYPHSQQAAMDVGSQMIGEAASNPTTVEAAPSLEPPQPSSNPSLDVSSDPSAESSSEQAGEDKAASQKAGDDTLKGMVSELKQMQHKSEEEQKKITADKHKVVTEKLSVAAATNNEAEKMMDRTKNLLAPSGPIAQSQHNAAVAKEAVAAATRKIDEIKNVNSALVADAKDEADTADTEAAKAAESVQADKVSRLSSQIDSLERN